MPSGIIVSAYTVGHVRIVEICCVPLAPDTVLGAVAPQPNCHYPRLCKEASKNEELVLSVA